MERCGTLRPGTLRPGTSLCLEIQSWVCEYTVVAMSMLMERCLVTCLCEGTVVVMSVLMDHSRITIQPLVNGVSPQITSYTHRQYKYRFNIKMLLLAMNTFQRTFHHLVASNNLLNGPPPLQPAPTAPPLQAPVPPAVPPTRPPSVSSTLQPASSSSQPLTPASFKIVRGRTAGSQNLLHNGHRYSRAAKLQDGRESWRCVQKKNRCKGRLYTRGGEIVGTPLPHNHEPDFGDSEAAEIISTAKHLAITTSTQPAKIMKSVKRNATNAALLRLPKPETLRRALNKAKKKENPTEPAPRSLEDLRLDPDCIISFKSEPMLLHDNEDSERRIIIFGTKGNLEKLQGCPSWYVDGTFKPCPELFYQLLTFHGEIPDHEDGNPWTFPCIYILLTHKDEELYVEAFTILASLAQLNPDTIMSDFELALRNALAAAFPDADLDCCFFHHCQGVIGWIARHGLKKQYEQGVVDPATGRYTPGPFRIWVRRLQHLAFVPVDDVPAAFHLLLDEIPSSLGLDDFLSYFMGTWIQGITPGRSARFPPATWNAYDRTISRLNRTNNYVEAWNKQFAGLVGHAHPTIWTFMSAMFLEQSSTDEKFLLHRNGDSTSDRKNRHVKRDSRIYSLVVSYDAELLEESSTLIAYLDDLRDVGNGADV